MTLVMSIKLILYKVNLKNNESKFQIFKILRDEIEKNTIKMSHKKIIAIKRIYTIFDKKLIIKIKCQWIKYKIRKIIEKIKQQ